MININEREKSANRSLERALNLLSVLEETGRPLTLTEISQAARLQKPTVQRLLAVFERYGYIEKLHSRYYLGPIVLPLAYSCLMSNELARISLPVLQELAEITKETVSVFVRVGSYRVAIQRVEGSNPLRYVLPLGRRLPLHLGVGKVLAAALPEDEQRALVENFGETRYANGTIATPDMLLGEFAKARAQGYAVSLDERELGISSVAAPVYDAARSTAAAVSVAAVSDRMVSVIDKFIFEVCRAAGSISERLARL